MNTGQREVSRGMIFTLLAMTAVSAITIDVSIPVLTEVAVHFGLKPSSGQLIISSFLAGYAVGQIPTGLLADKFGRIPVVYGGMVLFTLAGVATVFANSLEMVLYARFFQGLGACAGPVLGRAILRDISDGKALAAYMSLIVTVLGTAALLSPILGSFLVKIWNWEATFWISPLLGVLILVLSPIFLHETLDKNNIQANLGKQFLFSIQSFFTNGQAIWGTLITGFAFAGYMNLLASTSNIIVDIYGYPSSYVGGIFGIACLSYVIGAAINRRYVKRYGSLKMLGVAMLIYGVSGVLLIWVSCLEDVGIVLLWSVMSLYLLGIGFMLPNAAAITLDPLPKLAGFSASILGTIQIGFAAILATYSATLYDGDIAIIARVIAATGLAAVVVYLVGWCFLRNDSRA